MKNILGLDLGTNSIGWALVRTDDENRYLPEIKLGSRIIPMSQDVMSDFDKGVTKSQTAVRTGFRGVRRLRERCLLRRERLFRVLHVLGFLPEHFDNSIGWDRSDNKTYGKFKDGSEPKLAWSKDTDDNTQFIFMDSFEEMLSDFSKHQPNLVSLGKKVPLDWTLYYLRNKALKHAVSKQELAWILLSFNQKRGYYQLRGEEEEVTDATKKEEYYTLKVVRVEPTEEKRGRDTWYNIHLENGWVYRRPSRMPLSDWEGKIKEFIVTTQLDENGMPKLDKDGNVRRSFRAPSPNDWTLQKKRTEATIDELGVSVGTYIYQHLLSTPSEKMRGKIVRTIERKFYRQELLDILHKQAEFIPELTDPVLLQACIQELYPNNDNHARSLLQRDMVYLLVNDLLFYQRPLKSKKSLIDNCPMEQYEWVDKETGEVKIQHIKCVAKSNPWFQEFRLWQFIHNLRIYNRQSEVEQDVTSTYLPETEDYVRLFHFLNDRESITQDQFLRDFLKLKKPRSKEATYPVRWNYVEDKAYPCNETRSSILKALVKAEMDTAIIDSREAEYRLWHMLYSIDDRQELLKALKSYATINGLPDAFIQTFLTIKPFKKEYGAYSEKAIKRLLPLMRCGSLWSEDAFDEKTRIRIQDVIQGNLDNRIVERIENDRRSLSHISAFQMLPLWLASYVVYNRHSESANVTRWENPQQMLYDIRAFRQHSMRNPIVEQVVLETLRTVHDIWVEEGRIDEIHVELGRSMKSTSEQRARMTERNLRNEATNLRIKGMLLELKNAGITDIRPHSPMQQDILRIYEEGALDTLDPDDKDYAEITRISHLAQPTQNELTRYRLWLEQRYCSPYTGKPISLSRLFTSAYQIEHVIPQARFFDDSLSNKVICEAEINALKSNQLGMEFIRRCGGQVVHCPSLGNVTVLKEDSYIQFVEEHYSHNREKRKKLLMDDLPTEFIQRQMNDSRYISRTIISLLSRLVRQEGELESTAKMVIPCSGGITDRLKKDWGLNDVWNHLVAPRFERMNQLTQSDAFGHWEDKQGKRVFQTTMPLELQAGFSKKRIDHRHHAMDALAVACANRQIISYLNNESASDTERRYDLRMKLCGKGRILYKPWETFTQDAEQAMRNIIVTFKNYVRVINKASNYYEHYDEQGHKEMRAQQSSSQWAVRKPLHKETVFGHVNLQRIHKVAFKKALGNVDSIVDRDLKKAIKGMLTAGMNSKKIEAHFKDLLYSFKGKDVSRVDVFYFTDTTDPMVATRKLLDETFDLKRIASITDTGIQKILQNYLESRGGDPSIAFTPEGIADMNMNISKYNGGKQHQPIIRVRVSEPMGEKFQIGNRGVNTRKYVEAQKGTNLFYAIYVDEIGNRSYQTIPLNIVVERLKQGLPPVPEFTADGRKILFYLSPNDLVYVPTEDEREQASVCINKEQVYKMVSASGPQCFFLPSSVANLLYNKKEYSATNKMERAIDGSMIKAVCWKLEVDRLGKIVKVVR